MSLLAAYRTEVDRKILQALTQASSAFPENTTQDCQEFLAPARALLAAGKRTRAAFVAAGWQLFTPSHTPTSTESTTLPAIAGSAVELYQSSALIHDDIIDLATHRRGIKASHLQYAHAHTSQKMLGAAEKFGINSAILLGDFLFSCAALTFTKAEHRDQTALQYGTTLFHAMTREVAFGQYLDNRAEFLPLDENYTAAIEKAFAVLYHKSARYSVECPLKIGAALAGANKFQIATLTQIGKPLGEAFQLRDDQLGVFGDEKTTGKPSGGDLIEGKRTVLLGLTRQMCSAAERKIVDAALGNPLSHTEIHQIQEIMHNCGAYAAHEQLIQQREKTAQAAITQLPQAAHTTTLLTELLQLLQNRAA